VPIDESIVVEHCCLIESVLGVKEIQGNMKMTLSFLTRVS